ncbi:hypothetical protein ACLOJK_000626 [Asimina triloba]
MMFQGRRLLLNDEVASDEPVTDRGLTETPDAAAARRSLLQRRSIPGPLHPSRGGPSPGTGPHESPSPPITIPPA